MVAGRQITGDLGLPDSLRFERPSSLLPSLSEMCLRGGPQRFYVTKPEDRIQERMNYG
jgi:hypothetical protein